MNISAGSLSLQIQTVQKRVLDLSAPVDSLNFSLVKSVLSSTAIAPDTYTSVEAQGQTGGDSSESILDLTDCSWNQGMHWSFRRANISNTINQVVALVVQVKQGTMAKVEFGANDGQGPTFVGPFVAGDAVFFHAPKGLVLPVTSTTLHISSTAALATFVFNVFLLGRAAD